MTTLADLCDNLKVQCDPREVGGEYVGLEHIDPATYRIRRHGVASEVHSTKFQFRRGDVLYGKLRPYLDKAVLAERDGICSTDILVLRPKRDVVPDYLLSVLHSRGLRDHAAATTHGVNHPRTSWAALSQYQHSSQEHEQQKQIAAALLLIQRSIEAELTLVERARDLKNGLLRHLFTHGFGGEELVDSQLGLIPRTWRVAPFSDLRLFLQYGTSAKCDYSSTGIGVLRIPNIVNGRVDAADLKSCSLDSKTVDALLLEVGDLLFVRTNGVKERVGTTAVYSGTPSPALFASYLIRARLDQSKVDPQFVQYYTDTTVGAGFLSGRASPAADGKFNVNTKTIDAMMVPLPPMPEQRQIVAAVRAVDESIVAHDLKRESLVSLFASALEALVAGEVEPSTFELDTSEVLSA